ncbi:MAG: hypothetical protein AB1726_13390 [Planctomycetota bacterium]
MTPSTFLTIIATYRVRTDREEEFLGLLRRHHPLLLTYGLVTRDAPLVYRGFEGGRRPIFYEIFTWADADAVEAAHQLADVRGLWEEMGGLLEERDGRPAQEFPHVHRFELTLAEV